MLMPQTAVLRRLVDEYEMLLAQEPPVADPDPRLRDLEYTLCVSTGTRKIADALDMARAHLTATATQAQAAVDAPPAAAAGGDAPQTTV